MPSVDEIYPSRFIKAVDITDDSKGQALLIAEVKPEDIGIGTEKESKLVVSFEGLVKELVLNKTNAKLLAASLGDDYSTWIGCEVCLATVLMDYKGKPTRAIRVLEAKRLDTSPASCSQEVSHG